MTRRSNLIIAILISFAGGLLAAERFALPVPVPPPSLHPCLPEGEAQFNLPMDTVIPGTRIWTQYMNGPIWHYNTSESVGDGAAMIVYLRAGAGKPGWLCSMDTGVQPIKDKDGKVMQDNLKAYQGICLWIKGDGSDGQAVFSTNWECSDHQFRVPLANTNWHKVFIPWTKWAPKPITGYWYYLTYSLERADTNKANWYIVDRVHFFKEAKTEAITPTPNIDPPGMLPAQAFVSGKEHIARTLAKLKARQPVTIVVAGDSIPACAQLGYTLHSYTSPIADTRKFGYWYLLAQRLQADYGYPSVNAVFRTYDSKTNSWKDDVDVRSKADLNIISVSVGGWESEKGLANIDQILNEKPDLVLWEYGANDSQNNHQPKYLKITPEAIAKMQAGGSEVALHTLTPSADILPKDYYGQRSVVDLSLATSAETRKLAAAHACAVADIAQAFTARGILYVGDLYSDYIHPNHLGHEIIADVLEALLTDRDVRTWTHGPAADRAQASAAP